MGACSRSSFDPACNCVFSPREGGFVNRGAAGTEHTGPTSTCSDPRSLNKQALGPGIQMVWFPPLKDLQVIFLEKWIETLSVFIVQRRNDSDTIFGPEFPA